MNDIQKSLDLAASGMTAQATRVRHLTENIANADTPGYRRKIVSFDAHLNNDINRVRVSGVTLDRADLDKVYDPSHPMSNASGYYDGSNVDLVVEIADAREAQRSYEANLKMFEQVKQMSKSLLDLLRR